MRWPIPALVAALSLIALSVAFAAGQMYAYRGYYGYANGAIGQQMRQEMSEMLGLQQRYQSGRMTQEQYQQELQQRWQDMAKLYQQSGYGYGCPTWGSGIQAPVAAGPGMMGAI
jgi:hypothetical protein